MRGRQRERRRHDRLQHSGAPGGVKTIALSGSQLPGITSPVTIDGLTQPGADCAAWPPALRIEISNPTNIAARGLTLTTGSAGSTIRGLVINGFNNETGDNFRTAIAIVSNNNRVECNYLGTNAAGTAAVANLRGVDINSASGNIIGSDGTAKPYFARNLISGNRFGGISTRGNAPSNNVIAGNYIGTDASGSAAIPNGVTAISINGNPGTATGNVIGYNGVGNTTLMRNVISGNTSSTPGQGIGVDMTVGASGNRVSGNYIGVDASGTAALPNSIGVSLGSNASVSGNLVGYDGSGDPLLERNVIAGNTSIGVDLSGVNGATDNAVVGNYIGTNAANSANLPNGFAGINMTNSNALVARNVVRGNPTGIRLVGYAANSPLFRNGVAPIAGAAVMDSRDNCINGNAAGVAVSNINGGSPVVTTFENNWWGAANGPSSSGGSGDTVTNNVDIFPFLTAAPSGCLSIEANLALNVDVPDPLIAGTSFIVAFHVSNSGASTSTGGTVAATLPAALGVVDAGPCSVSNGSLSCPFASMAAGAQRDFSVTFALRSSATGNLHLQFLASGAEPDPAPANNSYGADRAIALSANVGVALTNNTVGVVAGAPVTYTLTVANAGPSDVLLADVTAVRPGTLAALTWTCTGSDGGTCPASGSGDIDADVGLPAGASLSFAISATVPSTATGVVSYSAAVASAVPDPVTGNDSALDSDAISQSGDLSVALDPTRSYAIANRVARFVLVAGNSGPSTIAGAQLAIPAPSGVNGLVWSCVATAGSSCGGSGNGAVADTLTLAPNGSATYTLSAITTGLQDYLDAQASLPAPDGVFDANPANNVAATQVPVSLFRSTFEAGEATLLRAPDAASTFSLAVATITDDTAQPLATIVDANDTPRCYVLQRVVRDAAQVQSVCRGGDAWASTPWLASPAALTLIYGSDGDVAQLMLVDGTAQPLPAAM